MALYLITHIGSRFSDGAAITVLGPPFLNCSGAPVIGGRERTVLRVIGLLGSIDDLIDGTVNRERGVFIASNGQQYSLHEHS